MEEKLKKMSRFMKMMGSKLSLEQISIDIVYK